MQTICLVDVSAIYWRAYHGSNADMPPDEVANSTLRVVEQLARAYPHVLVCADDPSGNWRYDLDPQYKATRKGRPEGSREQLRRALELIERAGLPIHMEPNHEADDVIAAATRIAREAGHDVIIATQDKDLMQLVGEGVRVHNIRKIDSDDAMMGAAEVFAKYKVHPDQIADWLALVGDASDNVPGVKGIGDKRAAALLAAFGTISGCLTAAEDETVQMQPATRKALLENQEQLSKSRILVSLKDGFHVDISAAFRRREPERDEPAHDEPQDSAEPISQQPSTEETEEQPMATTAPTNHTTNGASNGAATHQQAQPRQAPPSKFAVAKGAPRQPHATILTGRSGIGKTYLASTIPTVFFICVEQGLKGASPEHVADLARFEHQPRTFGELCEMVQEFRKLAREGGHRHLAVDSISGVERLINKQACNQESVAHMDAKEFKTVWSATVPLWERFQAELDAVRSVGVHVWLIAHSEETTETVGETGETYTKWDLSFQGSGKPLVKTRGMWRQWADHVLFIDWDTSVQKGKSLAQKAVGKYRARILRTRETPQHYAKNRSNLPPILPAAWPDLERAMRSGAGPAPEARLREQIKNASAQLGDEDRTAIDAMLANATTGTALAAVLSRAQGMISAAHQDDDDTAQSQNDNDQEEVA